MLFTGLAAYIAFFLELPAGVPDNEVYPIAFLTGAYGLWRFWNSVSACRYRRKTGRPPAEGRRS